MNTQRRKIGGKWKPVIMFVLLPKPERFNKIKQLAVGISANQLARCIKELENDKLIEKNNQLYSLSPVALKITQLMLEIKKLMELLE